MSVSHYFLILPILVALELVSLLAEPTVDLLRGLCQEHIFLEARNHVKCSLFRRRKIPIICDHFVPAMPSRDGCVAVTSNKVQRLPLSAFDTVRILPIIIHTRLVVFSTWRFVVNVELVAAIFISMVRITTLVHIPQSISSLAMRMIIVIMHEISVPEVVYKSITKHSGGVGFLGKKDDTILDDVARNTMDMVSLISSKDSVISINAFDLKFSNVVRFDVRSLVLDERPSNRKVDADFS
jgi:hypothetical protein